MAIGCNQSPFTPVDLARAADDAEYVKTSGLAGIMTWSLNRDTDHRTPSANEACNSLQTGEPDGIFIKTIYDVLQLPVTRSWWGRIRGVAKMGWAWPRPGAIVGGVAAAALAPPVARA